MRVELSDEIKSLLTRVELLSIEQKQTLVKTLETYYQYRNTHKLWYYHLDPVFDDFFSKGKTERVRGLIAANRVGKSYSSTYELACHLTGIYPTVETHGWDWHGQTYSWAIDAWALGVTSESIHSPGNLRDLLFGPPEALGTGWIPLGKIVNVTYVNEGKGIIKEASIKHSSGKVSTLGFRVYSQGMGPLMGSSLDFILIDECPRDDTIFPQLMTRIQKSKGKQGRLAVAATPEYGLDPLIAGFYNDDGQYHSGYCPVTVWDVSHITDADVEQMKADYPKTQWDMRMRGIPKLGSGAVYPIEKEECEYSDVKIEKHWKQLTAVDFGWDHPAAVVSAAYDPDTEIIYVFRAKKKKEWQLTEFAAFINAIGTFQPVTWPHDGANGTMAGGGVGLRDQLSELGCNMWHEQFYNPVNEDGKRNNSVESGLATIRTWLKTGRLKIHSSLGEFWSEYLIYFYEPKTGKPRKVGEDIMDAFRYCVMSIKERGVSINDQEEDVVEYQNYISADDDEDY